ncbi:MAG: DUF885 family protein [Anaeroplasmataceae bacterium]|nr:DUF885 family protein [Anaeroplasmataceae bacterium]
MRKNFKKIFYTLCLVCLFSLFIIGLASCGNNKPNPTPTPGPDPIEDVKDELKDIAMADLTVDYDGKVHSLVVTGAPAEANVDFAGSNDKTDPGVYDVTAKVTYKEEEKTLTAKLTINKLASVLTVEDHQVAYINSEDRLPVYTLSNKDQKVTFVAKKDGAVVEATALGVGTYQIEVYAPATKIYNESNHVTVSFEVKKSRFDVAFDSLTTTVDGSEKKIELVGKLEDGYTVEYANNTATTSGTYFAAAHIKDSLGNVVESHYAVLKLDNPDNSAFETYLDEFFVAYLEGDQLSVNIFCENPADFGLDRYEAKWYTYRSDVDSDSSDAVVEFEDMLAELHAFSYDDLSVRQQTAYNQIERFFDYYIKYYAIKDIDYKENHYVDQFGGYVADFGTYMEAYTLRSKEDVQDLVDYIASTEEAFKSYIVYLEDKAKAGYPLSDYTLEEMSKYLEEVLSSKEEGYYLSEVLAARIDATSFLTDEEKESFKTAVAEGIATSFMNGVEALNKGVEAQKGKLPADNTGYWATYEDGAEYFELELDHLLGLNNFNKESYIKELEDALAYASDFESGAFATLQRKYNISTQAQLNNLLKKNTILKGTPEEMLEYLKEFAKTIVPELQHAPNITIKEMDEASARVSNAVAYYMKSAIDNTTQEYITLNPIKLGDSNDVIGTLSHEGYPGHLYAYCYSKELNLHNLSRIMTSTAHGEGWATYVELKLYEYARENSNSKEFKDVMNYLYYSQLSSFLLETRIDAGIHLQDWDVNAVSKYLYGLGYNGGAAQDIYNLLIETPVSYAAYGYGKLFFYNLHVEAKEKLGAFYDEIEFNAMLLSKGWTCLGELENTYNEYMAEKMYTCFGILPETVA